MKHNLWKNKFVVSFLIILGIILIHYLTLLSPLEKLITLIISPFQSFSYSLATSWSNQLEQSKLKQNLQQENQKLINQIHNLELQVVDLKMFLEENRLLEQQSKFLREKKLNFVNAKVIAASAEGNVNLLTIDQGSSQGIQSGMLAVINQGVVVGKITQVENQKAWLLLLPSTATNLSAAVAGQTDIVGLVQGQHNLSVNLNSILKNSPLKTGDLIVTSGVDDKIPPGLFIGEVDEITEEANGLFKSATLKTQTNFKNLKIVSIILN